MASHSRSRLLKLCSKFLAESGSRRRRRAASRHSRVSLLHGVIALAFCRGFMFTLGLLDIIDDEGQFGICLSELLHRADALLAALLFAAASSQMVWSSLTTMPLSAAHTQM